MIPTHPNAFHGIYPATLCPFTPDDAVDETALARHVAGLADVTGIVGVLCNGHAGENYMLSNSETRRVAEIVSGKIGDRAIVVSGVNREGSREAADLACEVVAAGADAVMVFPPNAWALGQDARVALNHHRIILEAVDVPVMLFQGPATSGGFAYSPDVLAQLVRLPGVVAIKDGSWEVAAYEANRRLIKAVAPHVAAMASGDEHLFTSYVIGSEGSLVSLAVVIPEAIVRLDRAVRAGDLAAARAAHEVIYPLARAVYGFPPGSHATARLKTCLNLLGKLENDRVRPPIGPLDDAEREMLREALEQSGLLLRKAS